MYVAGREDASRVALVLPGRLDTKDYVHMRSHADFLASLGYLAVSFDPPGTWESPGDPSLFTTTNYVKVVGELIEFFGNRPTFLVGHSRGGATAILSSMKYPDVTGIVLVNANYQSPSDPSPEAAERGYNIDYRDLLPGDRETEEKVEFHLPLAYWEDGKNHDPTAALRACTKPKLIVHGTEDEFSPINDVKTLFEELPGPKKLCVIDSAHDYRYRPDAIDTVNREMRSFLEEYDLLG